MFSGTRISTIEKPAVPPALAHAAGKAGQKPIFCIKLQRPCIVPDEKPLSPHLSAAYATSRRRFQPVTFALLALHCKQVLSRKYIPLRFLCQADFTGKS